MQLTFLFTDIEGSTTLWEGHPTAMLSAIEWHDDAIGEIVKRCDGELVKKMGDGVMAVFVDGRDAVRSAVTIQRAVADRDFGELEPFRIRVGLHCGAVDPMAGDYYGPTVNRSARIMSVGSGGQTVLSDDAARDAEGLDGIDLRYLGLHTLRGVAEPVGLWQLDVAGLPDTFPPLSTEPPAHNLRRYASSFVGREIEMREMDALLERSRLVTLVGPGGCGKTRLSVELGLQRLGQYAGGTWFVDLASSATGAEVIQAAAVGTYVESRDGQDLLGAMKQRFRATSTLIIVDNCEHVLPEARELISELIHACPNVALLATTRATLGLDGEAVVRVGPLDLATGREGEDWSEAAALFVARALQAGFECGSTTAERTTIDELCRSLDGIPLAIELAASRLRVLTLDELRARLDQRLRLLKGSDAMTERHRTLQAAVEWSYDLLTLDDRESMYKLAPFSGGFELDAAGVVLDIPELDALEVLDRLVDQSLLQVERHDGRSRYRMLETMRRFGRERLEGAGRWHEVEDAHLRWVLGLAAAVEPIHMTDDGPPAHDRLDREFPNIRVAFTIGMERSPIDAAGLCADLGLYFWLRGHIGEGRRLCEMALDVLPDDELRLRSRVLLALGELSFGTLDLEATVRYLDSARSLALEVGDAATAGWSSIFLATTHATRGDVGQARAHRAFALSVSEEHVSPSVRAGAYYYIGLVDSMLGDADTAAEYLGKAVSLARQVGSPYTLTRFLPVVARQLDGAGDEVRALEVFEEALEMARRTHDRIGETRCLVFLAEIELKRGRHDRVESLLGEASPIVSTQIDDISLTCKVELGLATMYRQQGHYPEAETHLERAVGASAELGGWRPSTDTSQVEAQLAADRGQAERSRRAIERSIAAAESAAHDEWLYRSAGLALRLAPDTGIEDPESLIELLRSVAGVASKPELEALGHHATAMHLVSRGSLAEAVSELRAAVRVYRSIGHVLATIEVEEDLALVLAGRDPDEAAKVVMRTTARRRELGCPAPSARAARLASLA